nr:phospholipase-like protein [Tanacetum cinerariifolium]
MQTYDYKVTIRSRPSTIPFIKERLSKRNKQLKLFKDTVFGKYLDLDVEDNDNHLLNYVLHHQRPQLSKSIDSNLVFDIAGHTLLFKRSEFLLVTDFACRKLVFAEYMDDGIPPFLRRVFSDKAKNMENKNSLGKAIKGKAAKGKVAKGKDAKHKATQGKAAQLSDIDRVSAKAKFEETKSNREVALEEELDLWKSRYVELESYYKNLEASVEIARKNSHGLSFSTPNTKATSVCDDIDEADAVADDNAKATSVHDDVGVPNVVADDNAKATSVCNDIDEAYAAADDNAKSTNVHDGVGVPDAASDDNTKATSVCDDINEADAVADDNAKSTSVHDNVGVPDAAANDNAKVPIYDVYNTPVDKKNMLMKDVHEVINHTDPHIHGFQIMLWGGLEKKRDGLDEAKANQEVVSTADNGEVMKETQLPDSLENLTRDSNAPKTRIHVLKEFLDYLNQAKKPRHWFPLGNGLNVDEKFWQSLVARDATRRGFLTLLAIFSPYYCNLSTPYDLEDWIFKDIAYPVGWADIETAWGNPVWTGAPDVLLPDPVLKHAVPCSFSCFLKVYWSVGSTCLLFLCFGLDSSI